MAERVVGIGLPVTVSGLNVVFAGDDLDSEYYAILTTSHYVYNITRNDTQLITAKSGTEAGGYTLAVAAAVGWVTGDYCVPVTTNDKLTYNTGALAFAACNAGDRLLYGYNTASAAVFGQIGSAALLIGIWGLLARQRVLLTATVGLNVVYQANGILDGQAQCTARNLSIGYCNAGLGYNDSGGLQTGGGLIADRCNLRSCGEGIQFRRGAANVCAVTRCLIDGCVRAFNITGAGQAAIKIWNTTVSNCLTGYQGGNVAHTAKNVACLRCASCWSETTNATITYCASSDATCPAGAGNQINVTRAQAALWEDNDNHYYISGGRILSTSVLAGAGDYQAGQPTTDIDGDDITVDCPIGCHRGTTNAFKVTWPETTEVLAPETWQEFDAEYTGVSPLDAPSMAAQTPVSLAATETTIYECVTGRKAMVRVTLANTDASARTVTLYKVRSGDAAGDDVAIIKTVSLGAAGTDSATWQDTVRTLGPGDKISGLASVAAVVTAQAEVLEQTT